MAKYGLFHIWNSNDIGFVIANETQNGYVLSAYGIIDPYNGTITPMGGNEENGKTIEQEFLLGTIGLNYELNPMLPGNICSFFPWEYYKNMPILELLISHLRQQNDSRMKPSINEIANFVSYVKWIESNIVTTQFYFQ